MIEKVDEMVLLTEYTTGITVVDFYADWCGPCKMIGPVLEEIAGEMTDIKFRKLNIDENQSFAEQYNVMSIPTLIVFKDGLEVGRNIGFATKQKIETWIKESI